MSNLRTSVWLAITRSVAKTRMSCDHRGTQTVAEIVTTEDDGGDRIGDATRLSSCDGETVENEKVDVSKSLFFPIPGIVYVLLDIYDKVARKRLICR